MTAEHGPTLAMKGKNMMSVRSSLTTRRERNKLGGQSTRYRAVRKLPLFLRRTTLQAAMCPPERFEIKST
jgi:hypothetical protein